MHQQRPAQQRAAMRLVATGLSTAGYVTVATTMGLENILDHVEGFVDTLRPRARPRPGPVLPARVRRAGRARAVGLAVRRPPRVAQQPRRRRRAGRHDAVLHGRGPGVVPAARRRGEPAARPRRGPGPRAGALAAPRARRAAPCCSPKAPSDLVTGQPHHARRGRPGHPAGRDLARRAVPRPGRAGEAAGAQRRDRRRRPATRDATTRAVEYTATPKGVPAAELDTAQRELLRALLGTYFGRVPDRSRRWPATTTTPRSTPSTSPGPARPSPARRTTTGCRARGCSSSGTTPSAAPTTPTRSGATRGRLRPRRARRSTAPRTTECRRAHRLGRWRPTPTPHESAPRRGLLGGNVT